MRGNAMDIKLIALPLAFALFTDSGSRFDGRVAFRSAREAAFGPAGRPTAGFRRFRWRTQFHQKRRNYPMDPYRRQEHTSELQSRQYLVCRLLLEKKTKNTDNISKV